MSIFKITYPFNGSIVSSLFNKAETIQILKTGKIRISGFNLVIHIDKNDIKVSLAKLVIPSSETIKEVYSFQETKVYKKNKKYIAIQFTVPIKVNTFNSLNSAIKFIHL